MKCEIIRDLLPIYIDGLTSPSSNVEIELHLMSCEACHTYHQEMTGVVASDVPTFNTEEVERVDYLKKVRKKSLKTIGISVSIVIILAAVLVGLFAVGSPVSYEDVKITYEINKDQLEVSLKLENGKDLLFSGKSEFLYDESGKIIGSESHYKLIGVFHNPFDNVGTEALLGTHLSDDPAYMNRFIIQFSDRTLTFENGVLVP